jgi:hypothetical protein
MKNAVLRTNIALPWSSGTKQLVISAKDITWRSTAASDAGVSTSVGNYLSDGVLVLIFTTRITAQTKPNPNVSISICCGRDTERLRKALGFSDVL